MGADWEGDGKTRCLSLGEGFLICDAFCKWWTTTQPTISLTFGRVAERGNCTRLGTNEFFVQQIVGMLF